VVQADDFVRAGESQGNVEVLNSDEARKHVKRGDKLFGIAWITCANCVTTRRYYVFSEVGGGGWFAAIPDADKTESLEMPAATQPASDEEIRQYLGKLVPLPKRVSIPEFFRPAS
jgi:hypothetical protein